MLHHRVAAALPDDGIAVPLEDGDHLRGCEARQSLAHAGTRILWLATSWGIDSPSARRASRQSWIASLINSIASSSLSPAVWQPCRAGTVAIYTPSSS